MREIKFRGKRVDNGEWVYGSLIEDKYIVGKVIDWNEDYFNTEYWWRVIPETVGQFTGLYDKNGTEIYEGDILKGKHLETQEEIIPYMGVYWSNRGTWDCESYILGGINEKCEVIGNIHDNKE